MFDFVAIDFETANRNNNSACSIGLAMVKGTSIVDTKYYLIKPPVLFFNKQNVKIHGITEDDVRNCPQFPTIWDEIKCYFDKTLVIAHNAVFDMSVLKLNLDYYNLQLPDFKYADSMFITTKACGPKTSKALAQRAKFFNLDFQNHHNALADAMMCAQIVIETLKVCNEPDFLTFIQNNKDISIKNFSNIAPAKTFAKGGIFENKKVNISELIQPEDTTDIIDNYFYKKAVVFTGDLKSMSRKEAMQKVVNLGGIVKNGVSSNTNCLVVGDQDKDLVGVSGISSKQQKAMQLIEKGIEFKILDEISFLEIINQNKG